jgi:carbamate kinase
MRIVVALGGNALLRRGEPMTIEHQLANVELACDHLAPIARAQELVVAHGNGPQIGLLALEAAAYEPVPPYPLDVLGAETQGMIGYLLERELTNRLGMWPPVATLLTMIEVDAADPAFGEPTKPIGPDYEPATADDLATAHGWVFRPDGDRLRRVVPSPAPKRIVEHRQIRWLLERGCVVICAGGGGIPTMDRGDGRLTGVEGVIDKDLASSLLARAVGADLLVLATDVAAVYLDFGGPGQAAIVAAHPDTLLEHRDHFAAGSMRPKVAAACEFARVADRPAVIGSLGDLEQLVAGRAGTRVDTAFAGMTTRPRPPDPSVD